MANPLMDGKKPYVAKSLEAHCQWLNGLRWVQDMGLRYVIGERDGPDGVRERYLDRIGDGVVSKGAE